MVARSAGRRGPISGYPADCLTVGVALERRLAFGGVAALYDRVRPSYPPALVDDVIELAPLHSRPRALEVGAGTGKATMLFASRGVSVLALEPSLEMAAIAERNCARYPNVAFERAEFERWQPGDEVFPLVFSAQAWHWLSPELRYHKARAAMDEGGVLACFWNRPDWPACPLSEELGDAYRRAAPELPADGPMHPAHSSSADVWGLWEHEIEAAPGLQQSEVRSYRWTCEYSTEQYVRLLQTHSDHIVLDDGQQESLLGEVTAVLDDHGGGLEVIYLTWLCLARAG
jgi:SAM-dependent methyltransferase